MNKFVTKEEVFVIALNRNVDSNLIKPTQILVSQDMYIHDYIGSDLYKYLLDNISTNTEFIDEYIKPVVSWGVILNNFDYISINITDKGVIQMLIEGTANLIGEDARLSAKMEIRQTIYRLIKIMIDEIKSIPTLKEKLVEVELPKLVSYTGPTKRNVIIA